VRLRRRLIGVAVFVAALAVAIGVAGFVSRARVKAASRYVPPVFVEPGPGRRAPRVEFLGVRFGASRKNDVSRLMESWHVPCADRSMRTLMGELRDRKREELARAAASADAVSGASIVSRRTARDDNPQVRLSCEGVAASLLGDRTRPPSSGRVLFVFDTEGSVVRHASYQRNHAQWRDALADFQSARAALASKLGVSREAGQGGPAGAETEAVPKYGRRAAEWRFADLAASVTVVNLGQRGFSVSESVEVPLPVRADAPSGG
jgi:hypothetical protein